MGKLKYQDFDEFDDFNDEELIEREKQLALLEVSFTSEEFKSLTKEQQEENINTQQRIFLNCLDKLKVGTFHIGRFKKFLPNKPKYFVDIFGFDVLVNLTNKELYDWGFENKEKLKYSIWLQNINALKPEEKTNKLEAFERSLVGKEITLLVTSNKDMRVMCISKRNLIRVSWTKNEHGLYIYTDNIPMEYFNNLEELEKDKIAQYIKDNLPINSDKPYYYNLSLSAQGIILLREDEIQIQPRLLPDFYYAWDSYQPHVDIDPYNPNLEVTECGNVRSMKYTQMDFYLKSSKVRKIANGLNALK